VAPVSSFVWPSEDGWPYPDTVDEWADQSADIDDDLLWLRTGPAHLFDALDPLEKRVIMGRFGLNGMAPQSMKQLHSDLGLPRADLREALGSGLAKLRTQLS
jgi:DNA-directed RNA polymerase sigma subunit (sigma70/sigma32)